MEASRVISSPTKQRTPLNTRKPISVASIFKQQPHKRKPIELPSQSTFKIPRLTVDDTPMDQSRRMKARSSSHSPQKADGRVSRKRSDMHPLATAFRDTSDDYRRHLYDSTSLKINKTLEVLLNGLYESTLQNISPNNRQQDPQASPLKLSAPAKYGRMALKLYQPLSQYQLGLYRTDTHGNRERFQQTLETRMAHYGDHIAEKANEIAQLQTDWEATVSEIWKLGVSCLGEATMENLLFTKEDAGWPDSSPLTERDAEPTLFVSEQGISPPPHKTRMSRKRVTFATPGIASQQEATTTSKFPDFIHQPSRYRNKALPIVPPIAEPEIHELEMKVKQLGRAQIEEYGRIERDYQQYWKKKTMQLASALKDD